MAIEFPSKPDVLADSGVLDERLAQLEAAFFADQVLHESPALTAPEPPRTQREILAWTTRAFGPALIAVTAALSIAAGYVLTERSHAPVAPQPARHAAVAVPHRAAAHPMARSTDKPKTPAAHRTAAQPVDRHTAVAAPARTHASATLVRYALPQAATVRHAPLAPVHHSVAATQHSIAPAHSAPVAPAHHAPVAPAHRAPVAPATTHTTQAVPVPAHHHARSAAPQTAADQLAAWEASHPASQARASTTTSTEPAPQTRPRSEPASATDPATTTGTRTEPTTTTTSVPGGAPDSGRGGGTRMPPTNPGGIWNERLPGGGTVGGTIGPIIGAPRDPCTPRGGRVGIVMEAISVLTSRGH